MSSLWQVGLQSKQKGGGYLHNSYTVAALEHIPPGMHLWVRMLMTPLPQHAVSIFPVILSVAGEGKDVKKCNVHFLLFPDLGSGLQKVGAKPRRISK